MDRNPVAAKIAILAAIVCHTFWGLSFMASRTALNTEPVLVLLSHRFLIAFLLMSLLLPLGVAEFRMKGKSLLPLLLLGLFEPVIYFFGEQYGILHSTTIFSGVMISMIPIAATLAAAPVLGEKPTGRQLFYSLLSVAGVIGIGLLSSGGGRLDWIGVAALLVAVFSAVAYTLLLLRQLYIRKLPLTRYCRSNNCHAFRLPRKGREKRHFNHLINAALQSSVYGHFIAALINRGLSGRYTAFERTYAMLAQGAAVFTPLALLSLRGDLAAYLHPFTVRSYTVSVLFLAVCCSVICYFLSSFVLTRLPVARATVFANLTTAVSVFAGAVFLHEPFSAAGLLCCALILLGIYGVQRSART